MRVLVALTLLLAGSSLLSACGGSESDASAEHQGAAVAAVAQYFNQERAGGVLPEGQAVIEGTGGVRGASVTALDLPGDAGERDMLARYCMEYNYLASGFDTQRSRIYVAALVGGAWEVEAIDAETCDEAS